MLGAYPASMVARVGDRLPAFSADEADALRGSADFVGVNFYTSQWVTDGAEVCVRSL